MKLVTIVISCLMLLITTGCASNKEKPMEPSKVLELEYYIQHTGFVIEQAQKQKIKLAEDPYNSCKGFMNLSRIKRESDYRCLYAMFKFAEKSKSANNSFWLKNQDTLSGMMTAKETLLSYMGYNDVEKTDYETIKIVGKVLFAVLI